MRREEARGWSGNREETDRNIEGERERDGITDRQIY